MEGRKPKLGKIITFAGAVIAFTIGSGFATGQEILQYFSAYSYKSILVVLIFLAVFIYTNYSFSHAGSVGKFERGSQVFPFFCGKYVGIVFDVFSVVFCYMSFIVMVAGAAATLNQQYGLPLVVGGVILTIGACLTVVFGLNAIVDVLGRIGPVIVVLCIGIGLLTLLRDGGNIPAGAQMIASGEVVLKQASTNWLFSGASYAGFCMLWFAGFMAELGAKNDMKELTIGMVSGSFAIALAILLVTFSLIANIGDVAGTQIPSLILAGKFSSIFAALFSLVIFCGIYTTAVPLLWTASSRFTKEKSKGFVITTIILAVAGCVISFTLPFDDLVNIIYVLNGYGGILLILFMIIKDVRMLKVSKLKSIK